MTSITLQLFWTPDVIIHDLVRFNKPEILNQVGALGKDSKKFHTKIFYKNSPSSNKAIFEVDSGRT